MACAPFPPSLSRRPTTAFSSHTTTHHNKHTYHHIHHFVLVRQSLTSPPPTSLEPTSLESTQHINHTLSNETRITTASRTLNWISGGATTIRTQAPSASSPLYVPVRIPPLYLRNETSRFDLFRAWLRDCDEHGCAPKDGWLPTRVLDVSDPDVIRLVDGQRDWTHDRLKALDLRREWRDDEWRGYRPSQRLMTAGRFVALSHRWRSSDEHNFCTYRCNLAARQQAGMRSSDLPKRFQDAITVARALGVHCLWIDSICIVQPHREATADCPDGCGRSDDWKGECGKMAEYFGNAYCTVAATSATDPAVDEGILEPSRLLAARSCPLPGSVPTLWDSMAVKPGVFDDFAADVEDSELNRRGWVLQERALSCRTIHFTAKQAYWECGHGVRCESFAKLKK